VLVGQDPPEGQHLDVLAQLDLGQDLVVLVVDLVQDDEDERGGLED
jgi:hypothetical protein